MDLGSAEEATAMLLDYSKGDSGELRKPLPLQPNVFRKIFAYCEECEKPCTRKRWHHQEGNFDLCPTCFANGKYDISLYTTQFTLAEAPLIETDDDWTLEETLSLLRAILAHEDNLNWEKISEQVGQRTKNQCLAHFLRLPTYESILEEKILRWIQRPSDEEATKMEVEKEEPAPVEVKNEPEPDLVDQFFSSFTSNDPPPAQEEQKVTPAAESYAFESVPKDDLPLFSTQNPVMALIAYLASNLHPSIAAASAVAVKNLTCGENSNSEANSGVSKPPPIIEPLELYHCALRAAVKKAETNQADTEKIMESLILQAVRFVMEKIHLKLQTLENKEKVLQREIDQLKST